MNSLKDIKFKAIFDKIDEPIYISDPETYEILYVNDILRNALKNEKIIGQKCYQIFQNLDSPCNFCTNNILFGKKSTSPYIWEHLNTHLNRWYKCIDQVIEWHDGKKVRFEMAVDITNLKESESNYREALQRAEFFKDLFAHDVNNILQSIYTASELIRDNKTNPEMLDTNDLIEIILNQVIRGARLVSNVRLLSKLEETEVPLKETLVNDPLKSAMSIIQKDCSEKPIIELEGNFEKKIMANDFLVHIFENLLINAIEHNDQEIAKIFIKISEISNSEGDFLKMEFKDNGKGVMDGYKELIFNRGSRDDKRSKSIGLGLSVVKKILDMYNARIWVEDKVQGIPSKGSNFIILFPKS